MLLVRRTKIDGNTETLQVSEETHHKLGEDDQIMEVFELTLVGIAERLRACNSIG